MATLSPALISKLTPINMSSVPSAVTTRLPKFEAAMIVPFTKFIIYRFLIAVLLFVFLSGSASAKTILVLGDSLSAAYGIEMSAGWVTLLQQRLNGHKAGHKVVNASVSGDTSAAGLARLPKLLVQHRPDIVVLELGGNDGLRGLPLGEMKANLAGIIERSRAGGAQVVLVGIKLPPNYGQTYMQRFQRVYEELAAAQRVAFVPFLLDRVAAEDGLMQPDGIHPTAAAQTRMLENVWPALKALL